MNNIIQQITDWLKGLLVLGIMNNLTNTFSSVNDQVGQIATEVGKTPSSFHAGGIQYGQEPVRNGNHADRGNSFVPL